MQRIGLTGGIGMGKSTAADFLKKFGIPVVDSDVIAREVVEPGEPGLEEIRRAFGEHLIGPDDRLRRDELARIVFGDPPARQKLEALLHPRIRARWQAQLDVSEQSGERRAVAVIPLLFETHAETYFDTILCIFCSAQTQQDRLAARGWSDTQIQDRLRAQLPIEQKVLRSHFAIWNEGRVETTEQQLRRVLG